MNRKHLRLLAAIGSPLALVGCVTPGQRADQGCPPGEACSPDTPYGLHFGGNSFSDDYWFGSDPGVKMVAVGGRQDITVYRGVDGLFGPQAGSPFTRRFDATGGAAIGIELASPPTVFVAGVTAGSDDLRISDPDTGELFDQVTLSAAPLDRLALLPAFYEWVDHDPLDEGWAMYAGAERRLVAALLSAEGSRLVDDGLELSILDGSAEVEAQESWDLVLFDRADPGLVTVTANLVSGQEAAATVRLVDAVDELTLIPWSGEPADASIPVDGGRSICFAAHAAGVMVYGAPWEVTATGPVTVSAWFTPNCINLTGTAPGTATIVARVDDRELTVELEVEVLNERAARDRELPAPASWPVTAGLRAR